MSGGRGVRLAVGAVTETLDIVDSLYKGIPKRIRARHHCAPHDYQCKMEALWDAWDEQDFDPAAALVAMLNNQFEDYVYGRIGMSIGGASRNLGVTSGLGHALGQSGFGADFTEGQESPLPSLEYDEKTGLIKFSWGLFGW